MTPSQALSWLSRGYVAVDDKDSGKPVNCVRIVNEEFKRLNEEVTKLTKAAEKRERELRAVRLELSTCNAECEEIRRKLELQNDNPHGTAN